MYHILAGPEFNSPSRRPTTSLGILGAVQKQAVAGIKARLPENALAFRKAAAVGAADNPEIAANYVCGVDNTDPQIMDVYPNELVFRYEDHSAQATNMESFVADHPVYGKQYVTGDIQVEAFSALNGLNKLDPNVVFVGSYAAAAGRHI